MQRHSRSTKRAPTVIDVSEEELERITEPEAMPTAAPRAALGRRVNAYLGASPPDVRLTAQTPFGQIVVWGLAIAGASVAIDRGLRYVNNVLHDAQMRIEDL